MSEALVLGAGISGLAAAHALRRDGLTPRILEAADRPGGKIRTCERDGFCFEVGPNALQGSPELGEFLAAVGLADKVVAGSPSLRKRFVVHRAELVPLPMGPADAWKTPLFSRGALLRLLTEPFRRRGPGPHESVTRFVSRRLGPEMARLIDALVLGIFAGDPDELAMAYAFPKIYQLEAEHGSLFRGALHARKARQAQADGDGASAVPKMLSFPGGLTDLVEALAGDVQVAYGRRVTEMTREDTSFLVRGFVVRGDGPDEAFEERTDRLVCALPAHVVSRVATPLGDVSSLAKIPHSQVVVVNLGVRRDQLRHPLDGFGFLAPHHEGRMILGAIFSSTLFAGRAPDDDHAMLTVMVGGRRQPEMLELQDDQLLERVLWELEHLLGLTGEPVFHDVTRWEPGIPQADARTAAVHAAARALEEKHPGLSMIGDWVSGIGVPACIQGGWKV